MAMFDVDKIKTKFLRMACRFVKILDDAFDFAICQDWIVRSKIETTIENGMAIEDARFHFAVSVGAAVTTGVRELQADEKAIG